VIAVLLCQFAARAARQWQPAWLRSQARQVKVNEQKTSRLHGGGAKPVLLGKAHRARALCVIKTKERGKKRADKTESAELTLQLQRENDVADLTGQISAWT